jgi:PAT family beta-lactamase induction signal transducer AmpG
MAVDAGWSKQEIGAAVVTVGTVAALLGAAAGGGVHRLLNEPRALAAAAALQGATCVPVALASAWGAPRLFTTAAIACEHFASGLGTTVLFAALMSATRPSRAGLHYTVLTSANALGIGVAGLVAGALADRIGKTPVLWGSALVCLAPLLAIARWDEAARASAAEP